MVNPESISGLFLNIDFIKKPLLELGGGSGNLTKEIANYSSDIVTWELDKKFPDILMKNVTWKHKNIFDLTEKDIANRYIVSFPPYECLPHILKINQNKKAILMVSEKKLNILPEFKILKILNGNDFIPKSKGQHYIVIIN